MKILALDASTQACSAALLRDDSITEKFELAPRQHAQLLLPMARELLAAAQLELTDLDGIAVAAGPGAFTGIRIAVGMAQGLALGAGLPVATVSTLAALALRNHRLHAAPRSLVVQDARMQEVYWAAYEMDAGGQPVLQGAEQVSAPQDLPLSDFDTSWYAAGSGWAAYPQALSTLQGQLSGPPEEFEPHAEDAARLGAAQIAAGSAGQATQAEPSYVRDNVARKSVRR